MLCKYVAIVCISFHLNFQQVDVICWTKNATLCSHKVLNSVVHGLSFYLHISYCNFIHLKHAYILWSQYNNSLHTMRCNRILFTKQNNIYFFLLNTERLRGRVSFFIFLVVYIHMIEHVAIKLYEWVLAGRHEEDQ